jgi:predicted DNA-binding protein
MDQRAEAGEQRAVDRDVAVKKVTVNFAPETYQVLADLARNQGVTMAEALRRAIKLHAFLVGKAHNNETVLVRKQNGAEVELMLGIGMPV